MKNGMKDMSLTGIHCLLECQMKKLGIRADQAPAQSDWEKLLASISRTYIQAEQERHLLGHSLEVSSAKMQKLNDGLRKGTEDQLKAKRVQASEQLFAAQERAHVALQSIGDAVITAGTSGLIEFMNPVAKKILGWNDDAIGVPVGIVFRTIGHTDEPRVDPVVSAMRKGRVYSIEPGTYLVNRNLHEIAIDGSVAPLKNRCGESGGCVVVFRDTTEASALHSRLEHQAQHDMLTGLYNRYRFEESLKTLVSSVKNNNSRHAMLYMDLDQFKIINDTCGHLVGDQLLKQISELLSSRTRVTDTLARLGGDEFALLLKNCSLITARDIAESIAEFIREMRFSWDEKLFKVGVSIGLVEITHKTESADAVMSAADVACYAAKEKGRNRIHVMEAGDSLLKERRGEMDWASRITYALDHNQFVLYKQSVVPVTAGQDEGEHFEVLVRLQEPDGEIIPPGAFIPAAERYQLMASIDRWVIHNTLRLLSQNRDVLRNTSTCAINLSGNSLSENGLLDFIKSQVREFDIPFSKLCFEITETSAIADLANVRKLIDNLHSYGCRFSLDDFGSGLSSFAYLKELPVDYLKIDGFFVKDIVYDSMDLAMVEAINQVGHALGIRTIAEFVENEDILQLLRDIGVDYAQGYGIEKPSPLLPLVEVVAQPA